MKNPNFLFKFSAIVFGVFLFLILSSNTAFADVSQLEDTAEGPLARHQYDHYVVQTIEFPEMFVDSIKVKLRYEISNPTTVVRAYIYPVTLDAPPNFYNFCGKISGVLFLKDHRLVPVNRKDIQKRPVANQDWRATGHRLKRAFVETARPGKVHEKIVRLVDGRRLAVAHPTKK